MTQETKNLLLAMGLSVLVLVGWNYFYGQPQLERAKIAQQAVTAPPAAPGAPAPGGTTSSQPPAPGQTAAAQTAPSQTAQAPTAILPGARSRDEALAATPRVPLAAKSLSGSINLVGGRIDDVHLDGYRETTDPKSPTITLFSPSGSPKPYWAETGFVAPQGASVAAPTAQTVWKADGAKLTAATPVTLTWDNGQGLIFKRVISVDDLFMFKIVDSVENKSAQPVTLHPYALVAREGLPKLEGYAVLHEGLVGVVGDGRVHEYTFAALDKEARPVSWKGQGGWLGQTEKYWASAVIPNQSVEFDGRFSSAGQGVKTYQADVLGPAVTIASGASAENVTHVFAGAKETVAIDGYQASVPAKNFDLMIDWGWFYFITKPLFKLMDAIYKLVGNFGVAILIVTLIVKGVFFPLASKSYASMAKMKAVQPEMEAIKARFPDDRARQQQELMELYKKEKINPVAGCLPVMLQIPVFFALYKVIFITIEMRHAPFFGWIKDLSAPDPTNVFTLFGLIPFDPTQLPVFGNFLHLGVWPLIMGVTMFLQMKMNPEPTDPVQKTMFAWMPVIFTFMLGAFPAGLVIYWAWNNTLSILQQGYIMTKHGVKIEIWGNLRKMFSKKSAPAKG
jgi:YidC/Oxa1 family membrane protein insertase